MNFRRLSLNAVAALTQVVVSTGLMFAFYRYAMRILGPEQLGVWSLVVASTAMVRLGEFGLGGGMTKFVAGDLGRNERARAAATAGMSVAFIAAIICVVCLVLKPLLAFGLTKIISKPTLLAIALELLPAALVALWLNSLSQALLGVLDACQRSDLRALTTVIGLSAQLGAAYLVVPSMGLAGLGYVQIAQAAVSATLAGALALLTLGQPLRAWLVWDRPRLVEVLRYGGGMQLAALGQLFFEPAIKALLSTFGGLALTGYFEMANRGVTQVRGVIVAAYQVLVPYLAHRMGAGGADTALVTGAYRSAQGLLFALAFPYFACLAAALPLILTVWAGRFDPALVEIGLICVVGWGSNTLTTPAYMLYLAIGRLRWTVWSQVTIGILNIALGSLGGWLFGGLGVVAGAMLALVAGSLVTVLAFHIEFSLPWRDFTPGSIWLPLASFCGASLLVALQFAIGPNMGASLPLLAALTAFGMIIAIVTLRQPAIADVVRRFRGAASSAAATGATP